MQLFTTFNEKHLLDPPKSFDGFTLTTIFQIKPTHYEFAQPFSHYSFVTVEKQLRLKLNTTPACGLPQGIRVYIKLVSEPLNVTSLR